MTKLWVYPFDKTLFSDKIITIEIQNNLFEKMNPEDRIQGYIGVDEYLNTFENEAKSKEILFPIERKLDLRFKYLNKINDYEIKECDLMELMSKGLKLRYMCDQLDIFQPLVKVQYKSNESLIKLYNDCKSDREKQKLYIIVKLYFNNYLFYILKPEIFLKEYYNDFESCFHSLKEEEKLSKIQEIKVKFPNWEKIEHIKKLVCPESKNLISDVLNLYYKTKSLECVNIIEDLVKDEKEFMNELYNSFNEIGIGNKVAMVPLFFSIALLKENLRLKSYIEDLETQIRYSPGGEGFEEAYDDFKTKC
jgi:hypothetical protein